MFFDSYYVLLVLPAIILSLFAQSRVQSAYNKYAKVYSQKGITGAETARRILASNGVNDVRIETTEGTLTDHYDPRDNVIRLSKEVYSSTSISAVGIAAHEAGHAVQYADEYGPIKVRTAIIPITQFGASLTTPLILLGIILSLPLLVNLGLVFFAFAILFQVVTLPVEFNASSRAVRALESNNLLEYEEVDMTKKVLSAAAMTYLAALAVSLAQFTRLLMLGRRRR
ncbi:MAG: zinc metallopeptidase [Eubacteriales bacterium]|jgi:Zn-dependent membrane protease YugP